jgi:hypothetical protein
MRFNDWGGIESLEPSPLQELEEDTGLLLIPGTHDIQIVRGIAWEGRILQCKDENVLVGGVIIPDLTGTYVPSGEWDGQPLFILESSPASFIYYNAVEASYILARSLTTGALTDQFVPSPDPLTDEPTGDYAGEGAYSGTAVVDDNPTDLTGFTAQAVVRRNDAEDEIVLDLTPEVTDAVNGEITIPGLTTDQTAAIPIVGAFQWDLVITETASGNRLGPYIMGKFIISDNITQE